MEVQIPSVYYKGKGPESKTYRHEACKHKYFCSALENYDWHQILYRGEIDEKVNRFISIVNSMLENFSREHKQKVQ